MLHYINYYVDDDNRVKIVASQAKISYIYSALKQSGVEVTLVSTAMAKRGRGYLKRRSKNGIIFLPSIGLRSRLYGRVVKAFMLLQLFAYLVFNVKKSDTVIAYHTLEYILPVLFAKCIKGFSLCLEFNDKFSYYTADKAKAVKIDRRELKMISACDSFIFASPFMQKIAGNSKASIVNYGSYAKPGNYSRSENTSSIPVQIIYSGVIEPRRNSAEYAAKAMMFLDDTYVLHIAGFGSENDVNDFIKLCDSINGKKGYQAIIFHGMLSGDALTDLMLKCDIALNCHTYPNGKEWLSELSFPSKIPLNMAAGLYVVSPDLPVIFESPFKDCITFYSKNEPESISKAIELCVKRIRNDDFIIKPQQLVEQLDLEFVRDIKKMFS